MLCVAAPGWLCFVLNLGTLPVIISNIYPIYERKKFNTGNSVEIHQK